MINIFTIRTVPALQIIFAALLFCVLWTTPCSAGAQQKNRPASYEFRSLHEIPGVTADEIKAIEAIRAKYDSLVFANDYGTELFKDKDGNLDGFVVLLCEWLTALFKIPFKVQIYEWDNLLENLKSGHIAFTGELTSTPERLKTHFMTSPIAERPIIIVRKKESAAITEIAQKRLLRYGFLDGAITNADVTAQTDYSFETVYADNYEAAHNLLKNGYIDAFFDESVAEAFFGVYEDLAITNFLPLIFSPVSMSTQNKELKPIISVMDKALQSGAIRHLIKLYNQGYNRYKRELVNNRLTEEEKKYIAGNPVIPFAAEYSNYPISFYDTRSKEWSGIAFDLLSEIEELTGLKFKRANELGTEFPQLVEMLKNGEVSIISELIQTKERENDFLWPEEPIINDGFALISNYLLPKINLNEISYFKVGLVLGAAHAALFRNWFPNHKNYITYNNTNAALDALINGDVDLVMASQHQLLILTNYRELPGYKINYLFDIGFESKFGFHKRDSLLCSIVDKAMRVIEVRAISDEWLRRTYDHRLKVIQERLHFQVAGIMLLSVIIFILFLLNKKYREGKRLENQVAQRTAELEIIVKKYKGIIWSVDNSGTITKFEGQLLKEIGVDSSSVLGKNIESVRGQHAYLDVINNVGDSLLDGTHEWINEIENRILKSRTAPITDADGNMIGIAGSTDDVTKTVKNQMALANALEAAEAASKTKSAFLANMSHEIRTPMNGIIGFSELALDDDISAKTRGFLDKISRSAKALLEIINNILDISKIEAGKMELEAIPFSLHDVLEQCHTIITPKAFEKNIMLHFYEEPLINKILIGDPTRLRQALVNLLGNSVKFTNAGTVKLSATVESSTSDTCTIRFRITDSGIGMTSEKAKEIFSPFVQADNSTTRQYGGTGLGLPITKSIIEMMGGEITVESVPKIGSKFTFDIVFKTTDIPVSESINNTTNIRQKPLFSGEEVLVCEDNEMNQAVITEHLSKVNLRAVIAENGKIGVDTIKQRLDNCEKPFQLIFMDMHMPVMDGLETAAMINEMGIKTPIVAMTANIMSNDMDNYKKCGIDDCVGKPFTAQELWECLLRYIVPASTNTQKTEESDDDKLHKQLLTSFVKGNRTTFKDITEAIENNDIKLAHRLAHTLKSTAALIGKTSLQKAAADIESALCEEKNECTKIMIDELRTQLSAVLSELEEQHEKEEAAQQTSVKALSREETVDLISKLEPLLKSGNSKCLDFVDALKGVKQSEKLIEQMEDFDFMPAFNTLEEMKRGLGC